MTFLSIVPSLAPGQANSRFTVREIRVSVGFGTVADIETLLIQPQ